MEKAIGLLVVYVGVVVLVSVVLGVVTMWLWNWLMPELFGLPLIGFWQAVGINLLSNILFKTYSASKS